MNRKNAGSTYDSKIIKTISISLSLFNKTPQYNVDTSCYAYNKRYCHNKTCQVALKNGDH